MGNCLWKHGSRQLLSVNFVEHTHTYTDIYTHSHYLYLNIHSVRYVHTLMYGMYNVPHYTRTYLLCTHTHWYHSHKHTHTRLCFSARWITTHTHCLLSTLFLLFSSRPWPRPPNYPLSFISYTQMQIRTYLYCNVLYVHVYVRKIRRCCQNQATKCPYITYIHVHTYVYIHIYVYITCLWLIYLCCYYDRSIYLYLIYICLEVRMWRCCVL